MVTSTDIVNEALVLIGGNQPPVTGAAPNFDSSATGKVAAKIYASCVAAVLRQFSWDFARTAAGLALTANAAPFPWAYEYSYPANCVQVLQLTPAALDDANNPAPLAWAVGNAIVAGVQSRVIWTNAQNANAVFTISPAESTWDALFRAAVVRMLASEFAMGVAGRPDTAQANLQSAGAFETIGEGRDS